VKRAVFEVEADEVAPSRKFASAKVTKGSRSRADSGATTTPSGQGSDADPWAAEGPGGYSEAPPF
jgi:single-strand DNA-binding protein